VIDLAHGFGRYVVTVGIEKAADALALVSMGCDYGQGFLLGQPMPEERLCRSSGSARQPRAAASTRRQPDRWRFGRKLEHFAAADTLGEDAIISGSRRLGA